MKKLLLIALLAFVSLDTVHADEYFVGSTVADGVAGQRSAVILWNPSDSGVTLKVTSISVTHSFSGDSGLDINIITTPLGTVQASVYNKDLGSSVKHGEIRTANYNETSPPWASQKPFMEFWMKRFDDKIYQVDPPVLIPPGKGIALASAHNQVWVPATFQYSSTPLLP